MSTHDDASRAPQHLWPEHENYNAAAVDYTALLHNLTMAFARYIDATRSSFKMTPKPVLVEERVRGGYAQVQVRFVPRPARAESTHEKTVDAFIVEAERQLQLFAQQHKEAVGFLPPRIEHVFDVGAPRHARCRVTVAFEPEGPLPGLEDAC